MWGPTTKSLTSRSYFSHHSNSSPTTLSLSTSVCTIAHPRSTQLSLPPLLCRRRADDTARTSFGFFEYRTRTEAKERLLLYSYRYGIRTVYERYDSVVGFSSHRQDMMARLWILVDRAIITHDTTGTRRDKGSHDFDLVTPTLWAPNWHAIIGEANCRCKQKMSFHKSPTRADLLCAAYEA